MLAGVGAGIIGFGAGVFAIIWGLGLVEYMGGKKVPLVVPSSEDELKKRLLALNSPDSPYEIKATNDTDLLVEWKIADAKWWAFLTKERYKSIYRGFLVLDDRRRSARYCEETVSVRWMAGVDGPASFSYEKNFFRGRILFQKSWGVQYAIKDNLTIGKVYEYKFDVRNVRNPIKRVIEDNGWEFVPVIRKSHATSQSLKRN
jgi:hypothetical protein